MTEHSKQIWATHKTSKFWWQWWWFVLAEIVSTHFCWSVPSPTISLCVASVADWCFDFVSIWGDSGFATDTRMCFRFVFVHNQTEAESFRRNVGSTRVWVHASAMFEKCQNRLANISFVVRCVYCFVCGQWSSGAGGLWYVWDCRMATGDCFFMSKQHNADAQNYKFICGTIDYTIQYACTNAHLRRNSHSKRFLDEFYYFSRPPKFSIQSWVHVRNVCLWHAQAQGILQRKDNIVA